MTYDLSRLHSLDFESLSQSLCKKIIGAGCTSFGLGPDGGREATFEGSAPYPSETEQWSGYWIIQAKFKAELSSNLNVDFSWLKKQLEGEMRKFKSRVQEVRHPDNYILFTNVRLSSVAKTGGQDKLAALLAKMQIEYKIKNIKIISFDDLQDLLNGHRDIAISYGPFILPGDVLYSMLNLLNDKNDRNSFIRETMQRYLEIEFLEDLQSRLDQAGKLTADKVMLEKVFIDLAVYDEKKSEEDLFVNRMLKDGNRIIKWRKIAYTGRYVLKAGPGQGKSTLTQFLTQIYRAYFLNSYDQNKPQIPEIDYFLEDFKASAPIQPSWIRLPFKIILKDYAAWISETVKRNSSEPVSVLCYLRQMIRKKTGSDFLKIEELEMLVVKLPCLFIFDGLDEVPVSSNRAQVLSELSHFNEVIVRRLEIDAIIIASTRPQGYSIEFDNSRYKHLNIADLDPETCEKYITKLLFNTVDDLSAREARLKILKKALNDSQISRVMKSPLQASIMVILVNSGGEPPNNKFDLFKQYFETILNREKQRNISKILGNNTRYVIEIHYRLGLHLQRVSEKSTNPAANISLDDFELIVREYLTGKGIEVAEIDGFVDDIRMASIDRLVFISQIEDEKIGFAIRSLQEYFAANGYIRDVRDEDVKSRISAISTNSYWSNTLLFVIGHISQNKGYMIDTIHGICHELNGGNEDPGVRTLKSACLLGSWLALDILIEGIFRDDPGIENRFSQFLPPLLSLPFTMRHSDLIRLPNRIILKWVIPALKTRIQLRQDDSCWRVVALLVEQEKVSINEFLPLLAGKQDEELGNIMRIVSRKVCPNELVLHFIERFSSYSEVRLLQFYMHGVYERFLSKVITAANINVKGKIWELIIVNILSDTQGLRDNYHLLKQFGLHLSEDKWPYSILSRDIIELDLEIVDGFSSSFTQFKKSKNSLVGDLLSFSISLENKLTTHIFRFLSEPIYANFHELNVYINHLEPNYGMSVRRHLSKIDSTMDQVFLNEDINAEIFSEYQNNLSAMRSFKGNHFDLIFGSKFYKPDFSFVDSDIRNGVNEFADKIIPTHGKTCGELLAVFLSWYGPKIDADMRDKLSKVMGFKEVLKSGIIENLSRKSNSFRIEISNFYQFYDVNSLLDLYDENPFLNDLRIRFNDLDYIEEGYSKAVLGAIPLFKKLITLQLITSKRVSYGPFFQLLIYQIKFYNHTPPDTIPVSEILSDSNNTEPYRALILMLDEGFNKQHLKEVKIILRCNKHIHSNAGFKRSIREVLNIVKDSQHVDELLLFLINEFPDNYLNYSPMMNLIRNYVCAKESGVDKLLATTK
ncbi:hypothetical protein [Pedobacter gandavensis]|uniref:NACHT domain-containing protein n=1 Tax=Pedobacter gandavensis TaxID=2679963 RepID=UPI00292D8A7D|nr:hypothetical protein [Pedobacter gandavensis]